MRHSGFSAPTVQCSLDAHEGRGTNGWRPGTKNLGDESSRDTSLGVTRLQTVWRVTLGVSLDGEEVRPRLWALRALMFRDQEMVGNHQGQKKVSLAVEEEDPER